MQFYAENFDSRHNMSHLPLNHTELDVPNIGGWGGGGAGIQKLNNNDMALLYSR